jgi:integrase
MSATRRAYGSGALEIRTDKYGREVYYGRFRAGGKQTRRKLGLKRRPGDSAGLTKRDAERVLQRLIDAEVTIVSVGDRVDLRTAGDRYLEHLDQVMQRKATTLQDYEIILRKHLVPFFGLRTMDRIDTQLCSDYLLAKLKAELSPKTVANHMTLLHGIFKFGMKKGWAHANPVAAVDRPRESEADADIRFLTHEEVEALLRQANDPEWGEIDFPLWLLATTSGLRQGELLALRWLDVDWTAGVVRVRRNYTRKTWGTPKSRRSSRAVPLIQRTAGALDRLYQRSQWAADDDLVFAHPILGTVLDPSKLRKRFKKALADAGLREIRFHDLRHTFGTHAAAAGVPLRTLQEWMGHRDFKTTLIYADYAPRAEERQMMERAFATPALPSPGSGIAVARVAPTTGRGVF